MARVRERVPNPNPVRQNESSTPVGSPRETTQKPAPPEPRRETPTDYGSQARATPTTGDRQVSYSSAMRERGQQPRSPYAFTEQTPGERVVSGAGRAGVGLLKMVPILGNVLNAVDFVRDLPKAKRAFTEASTFGQKVKAGADLLFHGIGVFNPFAGAGYDMITGGVRAANGAVDAISDHFSRPPSPRYQMPLPEYQFYDGGYAPYQPMQYAAPFVPVQQAPYGYQQYPDYARYGYPTHPFGSVNDGIRGMGRTALGMVKMLPGVGNVANGVDFVNDLRRIGRAAKGDPNHSVLKSAADALFHGIGMIIPQVGGAYDMVQGGVRSTAAAFNPYNYAYAMPAWGFYGAGYPGMFPYMMW